MTKKSKIIISIIGTFLFVAIIFTGVVVGYELENRGSYSSSTFINYDNLPNVMQENYVYISNKFFEENQLQFVLERKDYYYIDKVFFDEVEIRGNSYSTGLYFLDFTRRNEGLDYYSFLLKRIDGSDLTPIMVDIDCTNKNLTVLFNPQKYGCYTYERFDKTGVYCINTDKASKKCQFTLRIKVEKSYSYSADEIDKIEKDVVFSLIDNILSYDEINARGGV